MHLQYGQTTTFCGIRLLLSVSDEYQSTNFIVLAFLSTSAFMIMTYNKHSVNLQPAMWANSYILWYSLAFICLRRIPIYQLA